MGYGYEIQGPDDRKVDVVRKFAQLAAEATLPGALLVNDLPFREWPLVLDTVRHTTFRSSPIHS
jgi:hypothetical protein